MEQKQHFLIVTYPAQGHVNPALQLANRLVRSTGALVTFSTAISGHRRMFPSSASPDKEVDDGLISYIPYSDGYDYGFNSTTDNHSDFISRTKSTGSETLSTIISSLAHRGRPVTCIIYTLLLSWVCELAHDHGIPSVLYWIQPATVFAIYYHYFHGYRHLISSNLSGSNDPLSIVNLPGLQPLCIRDLPSFLISTSSDDPYSNFISMFQDTFDMLDRIKEADTKQKILVNTFDELEVDALAAIDELKLIAVGPMVSSLSLDGSKDDTKYGADLFKPDEKGYMEWLDSKPEKSVVYVSFGSLSVINKRQLEEILWGLKESGRPYLWIVRKDNRVEGVELEESEEGMVVEWCSQLKVLSHPSVGCFVTHCGWNSTVESLVCCVPTVAVPQWSDQGTNARLMEDWGTGVRSELNKDRILAGKELVRCLEIVMGEGERGLEMIRKAAAWSERARKAVREGGSSHENLRAFVEEMSRCK